MFTRFIDENEIDEWFQDEKRQLDEFYFDRHYKNKKPEAAKLIYQKKLRALIAKMHQEHIKLDDRIARAKRMQVPIVATKKYFKDTYKRTIKWSQEFKKDYIDWRFQREFKKLMKK